MDRVAEWNDETQILDLSGLELTQLPELPEKLTKLNCSRNQLKEFNVALPENLTYLNCSYNQLEYLPALPEGLVYLNCSHNELKELPALPLSLQYIVCSHNFLDSITGLPDSLEYINFFENDIPNEPTDEMLSLPNIKKINGGSVKIRSKFRPSVQGLSLPVPKAKLGVCLDGDEPYRIETYLGKSKDNVVTGVDDFYNCCKRSKLGKGDNIVRYLGIDYYYVCCVERWVNKLDLLKIRNQRFCIYNFIDSELDIDGIPVSFIVPYTLKEYEDTN